MKVILLRGNGSHPIKVNLTKWHVIVPLLFLANAVFLFQFINSKYSSNSEVNNLRSLSQRFSVLEAQTHRLNMLGSYIADKSKIDIKSFNLLQNPPIGGVVGRYEEPLAEDMSEEQLLESIKKSEKLLIKQKLNLSVNETRRKYRSPVKAGYVTSGFGMRTDPINGRHKYHKGIDIAGKTGEAVNTIASGFVTFSGKKGGYGNVIEIHHSDSLKSRYAHLNSILVKKGEVVRKGKKIATMGSTGRVTGPHLHIEIWKGGKAVNPKKYINLALGNKT